MDTYMPLWWDTTEMWMIHERRLAHDAIADGQKLIGEVAR
jgi:hypothetical protein